MMDHVGAPDSAPEMLTFDGQRVRFTHPDRILYPKTGTSKGDVLDYYQRIAPLLIPLLRDRPATRKRWVRGTGDEPFFHKNLGADTPEWVKRRSIQHEGHTNDYPLVGDVATLAWFVQTAALEIHVPQWRFGRGNNQKPPDRMVFDLDPGPGTALPECAEVARLVKAHLAELSLTPWPVTSGSKGIHLYAELDGSETAEDVLALARTIARELEAAHPELVTSNLRRVNRDGRVLLDWSQNNASKTTVSPYSLRGRARPMVAAPRSWAELDDPMLQHLDYLEVLQREGR